MLAQSVFPLLPGVRGEAELWQVHAVVDTWGIVAFADLRVSAGMAWAVDLLHEAVLPWYEKRGVAVRCVETTRAPAFMGGGTHVYEAYLRLRGVGHRLRGTPQSSVNGYMGRFKQALTGEFVMGLRRRIESGEEGVDLAQTRAQLLEWVADYNERYPLLGYRNEGLAPMAFWKRNRSA